MVDLTYAVVRAAARKSGLMTDQQLMELASSKDLKEMINRMKGKYTELEATIPVGLREFETIMRRSFEKEVDEFVKVLPQASEVLNMIKKQVSEPDAVDMMKYYLGIIDATKVKDAPKNLNKEEAMKILAERNYELEARESAVLYEKYGSAGLVDSVFEKHRLLKLIKALKGRKRFGKPKISGDLRSYVGMKVDLFNVETILRGLKNGVNPRAIEELLIFDNGTIEKRDLLDVLKTEDTQKAITQFESAGLPKAESTRDLEKVYEGRISKNNRRTFYMSYTSFASVISYLELKLREIRNLIALANVVERGIDPKRALQEFVF